MADDPPFILTDHHVDLISQISEAFGVWRASQTTALTPQLRRENRIRTIQASLAIEQNTLSVEQVSAILEGMLVSGTPREIQEVRNAISAYDEMTSWNPCLEKDFLSAHKILMRGLVDEAGKFRNGGVGIYKGEDLIHMAPPADRVPYLVRDLFRWLKATKIHKLAAGAVVHYELEFIHPFADGNGRMGRLWQSLIIAQWKPELAWLPVETVVHHRQSAYYAALASADRQGNAGPFVDFILQALLDALTQTDQVTDQVTDPVTDPVKRLLKQLRKAEELTISELMRRLNLKHRPTFRANYLRPALEAGLIEMTQPDSPNSPTQRYRRRS